MTRVTERSCCDCYHWKAFLECLRMPPNTTGPYIQRAVKLAKLHCGSREQTAETEGRLMKPGKGFIWNLIGKQNLFSLRNVTVWTTWSTSGSREERCGKDGMYVLLKINFWRSLFWKWILQTLRLCIRKHGYNSVCLFLFYNKLQTVEHIFSSFDENLLHHVVVQLC